MSSLFLPGVFTISFSRLGTHGSIGVLLVAVNNVHNEMIGMSLCSVSLVFTLGSMALNKYPFYGSDVMSAMPSIMSRRMGS